MGHYEVYKCSTSIFDKGLHVKKDPFVYFFCLGYDEYLFQISSKLER